MPVSLPNIEANPVFMEQYPIIGEYIQGGHGTETDFFNPGTQTILPGEPVEFAGRLGISKDIILPGTFGTLVFGAWVNFLLDPDLASQILQGDAVYYDLDLAVPASYIPGYATNVQPTNGWKLGTALGIHESKGSVNLSAGSPIAATTSQERVFVLMDLSATSYGSVPSFLSTS